MGFVPLAFRSGSRGKRRTHIFWQRRVRAGYTTTPYWFPSQTRGGSIREDRLVLPIPPGTHWADAKPVLLPEAGSAEERVPSAESKSCGRRALPAKKQPTRHSALVPQHSIAAGGLWFAPKPQPAPAAEPAAAAKRERKPAVKNDPTLVAAARELRDRYLEQYNGGRLRGDGREV